MVNNSSCGHWIAFCKCYLHTSNPKPTTELPCSPISQILDTLLPVTNGNKNGGLQRELPTTDQILIRRGTVVADSQLIKCNRFSYQQVIHILLHCKDLMVFDFFFEHQ